MAIYTYIWEFHVKPDVREAFERHYGPKGTWAELFRKAPGYIETLLLRDRANACRYLTIDRWQSVEAYHGFKAQFSREYEELDEQCAGLTTQEISIGEFEY